MSALPIPQKPFVRKLGLLDVAFRPKPVRDGTAPADSWD